MRNSVSTKSRESGHSGGQNGIIYKYGDPTGLTLVSWDYLQIWRPYGPQSGVMGLSTNMVTLRASIRYHGIIYYERKDEK